MTAAHVAGVFSLEDACTLVLARGRLMQALPEGGAMASLEATEDEVAPLLAAHPGQVSVAAVNGPRAVVVAGERGAVEDVSSRVAALGRRTRGCGSRTPSTRRSWSPCWRSSGRSSPDSPAGPHRPGRHPPDRRARHPGAADLRRPLDRPRPGGGALRRRCLTLARRPRHRPVPRTRPRRTLAASPAPSWTTRDTTGPPCCRRCARTAPRPPRHRGRHRSVPAGHPVRWKGWFEGTGAAPRRPAHLRLPAPPLLAQGVAGLPGDLRSAGLGAAHHPLLPPPPSPSPTPTACSSPAVCRRAPTLARRPRRARHRAAGRHRVPGMAVRAGDEVGCERVEDLTLAAPLALPRGRGVKLQVWIGSPDETGRRPLSLYSRPTARRTALDTARRGHLAPGAHAAPETEEFDAAVWPPVGAEPVALDGFYDGLADAGFSYGPAFRGLRAVWRRGEETFAEVALDAGPAGDAPSFGLHPRCSTPPLHATALAPLGEDARGGCLRLAGRDLHASGAAEDRVRITRPVTTPSPWPWPTPPARPSPRSAPWYCAPPPTPGEPPPPPWNATPCSPSTGYACPAPRGNPSPIPSACSARPVPPGRRAGGRGTPVDALTGDDHALGAGTPELVLACVTGAGDDVPAAVHTLTARVLAGSRNGSPRTPRAAPAWCSSPGARSPRAATASPTPPPLPSGAWCAPPRPNTPAASACSTRPRRRRGRRARRPRRRPVRRRTADRPPRRHGARRPPHPCPPRRP
nr:polyketide synthase dehydratase domain-containing protein [Streptomyces sp. SS52]